MNQFYLSDLKKRTTRGQRGQKDRGFSVGERTYGYRSYPHGDVRIDKRGRPRPDGYKPRVEPAQAAVVRRIFEEYAAGRSLTRIVQQLNEDGVPRATGRGNGWSPSTVHRVLQNTKCIGRWVWNRFGNRRDPRTGRRRRFKKPESEHHVIVDESLRIVPQELWEAVRAQEARVSRAFLGGQRRGFSRAQGHETKEFAPGCAAAGGGSSGDRSRAGVPASC